MTSLVFWLILWAITAPLSYIAVRHDCRRSFGKWTQADRIFCAIFCLLYGPIMLAMVILGALVMKIANTHWAKREVRW